jgi:antitoxin YefM
LLECRSRPRSTGALDPYPIALDQCPGKLYCESVHIRISEYIMAIQTTYTKARANFAKLCNEVAENREIVIINRRGNEDVALVSADELSSLIETAHLLRSPKNAQRLLAALNRARSRKLKPQGVAKLRQEIGLDEER